MVARYGDGGDGDAVPGDGAEVPKVHSHRARAERRSTYNADGHGGVVDLLSIPDGLYFLWVGRGLYRDSLRDWIRVTYEEAPTAA